MHSQANHHGALLGASDRMTNARMAISGSFPHEAESRFPLEGGRWLTFGRGTIHCEYGFLRAWSPYERSLEDHVSAWLEVSGSEGQVFRLERTIRANVLLELVRLGQPIADSEELRPFLRGIRCWHDQRCYVPTIIIDVDGRARPFAYFAEGLAPRIDLLKGHRGLVVRVHPVEGGGIGGVDAPKAVIQTSWGPRVVLWSSPFGDALDESMSPSAFRLTTAKGEPQPLVAVV